ncbi:MAG TPA: D,D-dipeptide ABC transporter permease, partial [Citreicella sp.]|nr:D,D-dipeptide ABC transporter permease [Citreicella sp.]
MTDAVSVPPRPDRLARALFRFRQSRLSVIGAVMVAVVLLLAVFGPMIAPYPQDIAGAVSTAERFQPPSLAHP